MNKSFLKNITNLPGVYQMFDKQGEILYVGKAKQLKKRVSSYFRKNLDSPKTKSLMQHVNSINLIVTNTENEALILENQIIKQHHPRYNILFRDDKSYPYIFLSDDDFPRISVYRGNKKEKGFYFGPFANLTNIKESLNIIKKLFGIRPCKNSFFRLRNRPCLQYQIKRCNAPCVGLISKENYRDSTNLAKMFLEGNHSPIIEKLKSQMKEASKKLQYENAAKLRDQIDLLLELQTKQCISSKKENADVIAISEKQNNVCIHLLIVRHGKIIGNKKFFAYSQEKLPKILSSFISQYYLNDSQSKPHEIILNIVPFEFKLLKETLKVNIKTNVKKIRAKWLKMAIVNSEQNLENHINNHFEMYKKFLDLQKILNMKSLPKLIECFDISHTQGEATIASCVSFNSKGSLKENYRKFNIENIKKGDDLAAMKQAIIRRFKKSENIPDIIIIDGGKGQIKQAKLALKSLKIKNILILGIAKGDKRKPGLETIYFKDQPLKIEKTSKAFHLLQQIRDEAHRFAITSHRKKRDLKRKHSSLEDIPGVGPKRSKVLLKHFGSLKELQKANVNDIAKLKGINLSLAFMIHKKIN